MSQSEEGALTMCWLALDPTSACVVVLIITLLVLWAYVTISKERTRLPNLTSVLHEVSQKSNNGQTGNKKASKNKWKRKQVDGNSKIASKDVKVLPAVAGTNDDASSGAKVQPLPALENRSSSDVSVSDATEQVLQKGREKKKEGVRPKQSQEKKKAKSGKGHVLEEAGEWQTQLSRPQLRALRQKQRTDEQKDSQDAKNSAVAGNSDGGLEKLAGAGSLSGSNGSSEECVKECVNGDSSGISKDAATSESGPSSSSASPEVTESSDDRVKERPGSQNSQSSTGTNSNPNLDQKHGSPSLELFLASSLPVIDVETALVEAARSSVSSIEEEKLSGPVADATTKKKKRKSRRKNKQVEVKPVEIAAADSVEPEAVPDSTYNQEDWVVIN